MSHAKTTSHRVVALVGSYLSGKTSLLESLLHTAGTISRKGSVKEGNTLGDSAPEARAHQMSVEINLADAQVEGCKFTFIDCPGSQEYLQEARNALNVVDAAIVVCDPDPDRMTALKPIIKTIEELKIPHFIFINRLDAGIPKFQELHDALQFVSDAPLVFRQIPIVEGEKVIGFVDLLDNQAHRFEAGKAGVTMPIPDSLTEIAQLTRQEMLEKLSDYNDKLMEKLLEEKVPPVEELKEIMATVVGEGHAVPVFMGSALESSGVDVFLKALVHEVPPIDYTCKRKAIADGSEPLVQVFKTLYLPHKGKMSICRVWRGSILEGNNFGGLNIGGIVRMKGQEADKIAKAELGEIFAFNRLDQLKTGMTLSGKKAPETISWPEPMHPLFSLGLHVSKREDEMRLTGALAKVIEEDTSLIIEQNQVTKELLLSGQGEVQIKIALEKLKNKYNVDVSVSLPQIPYRETIKRAAQQQGRHKKQTGGHGQFGDVHLEIKPRPRDSGFEFGERITGGSVPRNYWPAVEVGVRDYLEQGPLGFNIVDISVVLFDGSYHKVDSNDLSFRLAAVAAMKEAMPKCEPVLLEPIFKVEISVPSEHLSKAQKLVSGLRGQILGFEPKENWRGWDTVNGMIPQAEMHNLIVELRSLTQGLGFFTCQYDRLQELTGRGADIVVDNRKKYLEEKRNS